MRLVRGVAVIGLAGVLGVGVLGCASGEHEMRSGATDTGAGDGSALVTAPQMLVTSRDCDISIVPYPNSTPDRTKQVLEFYYRNYGMAGIRETAVVSGGQVVLEFWGHATKDGTRVPHDLWLEAYRTASGNAGKVRGTIRLRSRRPLIGLHSYQLYLWGFDDRSSGEVPDGRVLSTMVDPHGKPVVLDRTLGTKWENLEIAAEVKPWHSKLKSDQPWVRFSEDTGTLQVFYLDEILTLRVGP